MSGLDLQALGISKEELQDRVIDRAVERIFETTGMDEFGDETIEASPLAGRLEKAVKTAIDVQVGKVADAHVLPITAELIENIVMQQTNTWGEKTGAPVTFREYLVQRANHYLTEQVDHNGKSKSEESYNWRGSQTRITYLVNSMLQHEIKIAMESAIKVANEGIAEGLHGAVKLKLAEILGNLKVAVSTK